LFRQRDHGVGELDFAAGAALLLFQEFEDFRLQDVAAGALPAYEFGYFRGKADTNWRARSVGLVESDPKRPSRRAFSSGSLALFATS
jgi:hypothetical protein